MFISIFIESVVDTYLNEGKNHIRRHIEIKN
jgi:hypothetical protein